MQEHILAMLNYHIFRICPLVLLPDASTGTGTGRRIGHGTDSYGGPGYASDRSSDPDAAADGSVDLGAFTDDGTHSTALASRMR